MSPTPTSPKILLIDGHSLAFRAYFAYAKGREGGLRTKTGIPTSVSYGFLKALLDTLEAERPEHVMIAFDLGGPTYRHEADETYKAGRPETPEDFIPDLKNLQELLAALQLPIVTAPGYEADDVIGTIARRASAEGFRVKILSGDRDLFQLVDPQQHITVLYLSTTFGKGTPPPKEFGLEQVKQKMGILPSQVVDYKALCGDPSDNIPGVKGIGDKTAVQLLNTYGSLEHVYASLDQIKGAVRKRLEEGKESALHSQYMAQIHLDVPVILSLDDFKLKGFDVEALAPLLEKLEFRQFASRINHIQQLLGGKLMEEESSSDDSTRTDSNQAVEFDVDDDLDFFTAEETEASQRATTATILPQIVDSPEKLTALVNTLVTHKDTSNPVAWDTETTALEPRDAELVGIGCCWGTGRSDMAYIPINHREGTNLDKGLVLDALRPILESADYPKVLQNAKFDRLVLRCQGITLRGVVFDTMLASYVLNPENSHNLGDLGLKYLNLLSQSYENLVPKGKTIADLDVQSVANYCGMDAYVAFQLVPKLRSELQAIPHLYELLLDIEQPLEPVLAEMEYTGIRVDRTYLQQFSKRLEQDLHTIEQQAYEAAGDKFSLGSPKQLAELLFEKLGLDRKLSRKTKTGYSTDAATLEKLQNRLEAEIETLKQSNQSDALTEKQRQYTVVSSVIEHRTLSKLKSTYVDALPNLIRSDTQRVHTDFNQAITTTGRLSSSNPNLQNIPIRTAFSRQIRAAFIPEPNWLIVAADYSQIELRILAHLSQEPVLLETYKNNQDIHALTARLLFQKDEITPEERRLAKVINFGVIYGMGAQRFARESGSSTSEAKVFIERFNQEYSNVFAYLQQMQREAIGNGYVTTIKGRRRYFNFASNNLKSLRGKNPNDIDLSKIKFRDQYDAQLLRAAANAPIQGSSADIIKIAMVKLHELLKSYRAHLLLQVHDELVFEVHPEDWQQLQPHIKDTMESAVDLSVPLKVEVRAGENWMEAK
ncbi:DNA polymerase I [Thermocoleostomius sinensis]|uniref:DNA polymerase I n=1 Tax=Thermocoleostomius sinensis A174 TaxID=2016057 RepID=A0A9E8Z925_9CYAN|nr:DNA polymerase I [Thermocoleostomius sinensis]WAL58552.1 DNA polymerase I [Thermocoleostomius sinensis A174]